jgi:hypothetical protein
MKEVYKCELDGKVFERKVDCMRHEFELNGGSKRFENEVKDVLQELESETGLEFNLIESNSKIEWDGDPNTDIMRYVESQTLEIEVYYNGEQRGDTYSRGSEGGFTKDVIREELLNEYVVPYENKFEGFLEENDDYYSSGFNLNGIELDKILRAMYGKKIRLEVIE